MSGPSACESWTGKLPPAQRHQRHRPAVGLPKVHTPSFQQTAHENYNIRSSKKSTAQTGYGLKGPTWHPKTSPSPGVSHSPKRFAPPWPSQPIPSLIVTAQARPWHPGPPPVRRLGRLRLLGPIKVLLRHVLSHGHLVQRLRALAELLRRPPRRLLLPRQQEVMGGHQPGSNDGKSDDSAEARPAGDGQRLNRLGELLRTAERLENRRNTRFSMIFGAFSVFFAWFPWVQVEVASIRVLRAVNWLKDLSFNSFSKA